MANRGINKVIVLGHLGQDPEVRYMPSGGQVTNIRIATSESWRDKDTGEQKETTEWHRVVFFNKLAEIAGQYLKKGSQVYIEGSLRTRKWQGQDGQDRYSTEIIANEMQMLGGKPGSSSGQGAHQDGSEYDDSYTAPQRSAPQNRGSRDAYGSGNPGGHPGGGAPRPPANKASNDFVDDDIPF